MKIKAFLGVGFCGATRKTTIDIDDDELEGMTKEEREDYISETVQEWANNYIEVGWEEED